MSARLKDLLGLQDLDREILRLKNVITARPAALGREEVLVKEAEQELDKLKLQIRDLQKMVDGRHLELKTAEDAVKKMDAQAQTLKTNEEYHAMQKQVSGKKAEIGGLEDRILEAMEVVEKARKGVPAKEAAARDRQKALATLRDKVAAEVAANSARVLVLEAEWTRKASSVPSESLDLYKHLRVRYGATALAHVTPEGVCQGCFMGITAHRLNQAMAGETIQCTSCARLLYMAESAR